LTSRISSNFLLLGELQRHVRRTVSAGARLLDAGERRQHLGGTFC